MKKHLFLFTLLSLFVFTQVGSGQTTYTWIGGVSDWNTASNWNPARNTPAANDIIQFTAETSDQAFNVPSQTIGQLIISTNSIVALGGSPTLTITSSATVNGSLELNGPVLSGAGSFMLGASGTLKIYIPGGIDGTITMSGTKTFTDGASYFFGNNPTTTPFSSSVSSVIATNITSYVSLTLNKDVSVTGIVSIVSPLTLGTNNLTLQSSATVVGVFGSIGVGGRMIVPSGTGEFRKVFTTTGSFTFPVGTTNPSNTYSPVTVNFGSGSFSSAYVGVKLVNSKHPNNTSATNYINRYWTITQSGISSFSCNVTATYVDGDIAGTEASIYCSAYNGSSWTLYGATNTGSNQLTAAGVTSFSDFTGGEPSALPVELTSFTALASNSKVELNWNTATEVNNYGFEIERSVVSDQRSVISGQLLEWDKIGFVQGNGNSNSPKEYSFTDPSVTSGSYAYRLKQLDNDGKYEYSKEVEIDLRIPVEFSLRQNYPNPFNPTTTIQYNIPITSFVKISVYDILGKEIKQLVNELRNPGHHEIIFDAKELASGIYYYTIRTGEFTQSKKMILLK